MPRAKSNAPDEYKMMLWDIAYLKSYSTDLLYDAKTIYTEQMHKYWNWYNDSDAIKMKDKIIALSDLRLKIINQNRVYIVCGDSFFRLVMYNMDDCVIDNLILVYDYLSGDDDENLELVSPDYRSTLFVFKGKELVVNTELTSGQLVTLTAVFHKENLVNFSGARYDYYGKPRAEAKSIAKRNQEGK